MTDRNRQKHTYKTLADTGLANTGKLADANKHLTEDADKQQTDKQTDYRQLTL